MPSPLLQLESRGLGPGRSTPRGWKSWDLSHLPQLADALDVGRSVSSVNSVATVPSVWSRFFGFAIALRDRDHPAHDTCVESFRGILAVLAMRVRKHIAIEISEVDVTRETDDPFIAALRSMDRLFP